MKKVLLLLAVLVAGMVNASAQSENYKAFKVDVGALYAIPSGDGAKAGAGFYIEPKYNLNDNIALGLKMEWAMMGAEDVMGASVDVSALGSYQLTGDYYFGDKGVRPFVGLGAGIYSMASAEIGGVEVVEAESNFGFAPRAGLLLGHFRLGLEYNVITGLEESNNYLSFKVGFEIGGGKK